MGRADFLLSKMVRRTAAESEALCQSFLSSGLNQQQYCREHGVSKSTLSSLLNRRRRALAKKSEDSLALRPVELISATQPSTESSIQLSTSSLAIEIRSGLRVVVSSGFEEATLLRLLALLERR